VRKLRSRLNTFMGSGTTGIACKNMNRSFIGIEMIETNFLIAKNRIETHNVQSKLF
jgi:site-specific DNA-methyltransferase (adenine-specific)